MNAAFYVERKKRVYQFHNIKLRIPCFETLKHPYFLKKIVSKLGFLVEK